MGQDFNKMNVDSKMFDKNVNKAFAKGEAIFNEMKGKGQHIEQEIKKYADNADAYIKRHPVKATILAGVAGLVLGKFLMK